jgi:hypothetical protein
MKWTMTIMMLPLPAEEEWENRLGIFALTSLTIGGRSVGIVRSRNQATELSLVFLVLVPVQYRPLLKHFL